MNKVKLALVGGLVLGLTAAVRADEGKGGKADIQQKLVGTWEVVKFTGKKGGPPPGATFEFTRDGKVIATAEEGARRTAGRRPTRSRARG
jgi:hypothetical protein